MKDTLQINAIASGYGKVQALRDLTLHIGEGEIVAVIGPNGAGKSTLLKTISGLVRATSGEIWIRGQNVTCMMAHDIAARGVAHVPEGGRLFANMSVRDNLVMGAYNNRKALGEGVLEEIYALFPVLRERANQLAGTLSGGQKQMLAIGRGLASRPSFIMLDEPSLGLAPKLIDDIYATLHKLRGRGLTILLVEQNTTYALELADRGYVLENGSIVMEGSGTELAGNEHIRQYYLGM